jgi:hypothetical protein
LSAFEGSSAISSDAYFGNDDGDDGGHSRGRSHGSSSRNNNNNDPNGEDYAATVVDAGRKIANVASSFFSDLAERYSS